MNFMQPAALWMAVTLILVGLLMVALSVRSPILARLGLRNIPRRPLQSFLIVVGLTLSTTIFTAALSLGDTLNHSLRNQVVEAYGHVDQVISPAFLGTLLELADDGDFEVMNSHFRYIPKDLIYLTLYSEHNDVQEYHANI